MTFGQIFTALLILLFLSLTPLFGIEVPHAFSGIVIGLFYSSIGFVIYFIARASGRLNLAPFVRFVVLFAILVVTGNVFASLLPNSIGRAPWSGGSFITYIGAFFLPALVVFSVELAVMRLVDSKK